jgi:hypothetical protein
MRKHWIVGASTLIGIAAVVAAGAGAAAFGMQSSAPPLRVARRMRPPAGSRPT